MPTFLKANSSKELKALSDADSSRERFLLLRAAFEDNRERSSREIYEEIEAEVRSQQERGVPSDKIEYGDIRIRVMRKPKHRQRLIELETTEQAVAEEAARQRKLLPLTREIFSQQVEAHTRLVRTRTAREIRVLKTGGHSPDKNARHTLLVEVTARYDGELARLRERYKDVLDAPEQE